MPRIARIVVPGEPHHVVQRGNRRLPTFFQNDDYFFYIEEMREWCDKHSVEVWAYCLMTNHVHLIVVPGTESGLRLVVGEAHRRFSLRVNRREGWTGHLWQGRFSSFVMDDYHLLAAARYVELNPVRAGIVNDPSEYPWSSAKAHIEGRDDFLVKVAPLLSRMPAWEAFLGGSEDKDLPATIQRHERTGRPLGSDMFFDRLQSILGKDVRPKKPGPKKKRQEYSP